MIISNSQGVWPGFSLRSTTQHLWVMWIDWQNKMSHGCLTGRPYPRDTRETQLSPSCTDFSHSSHVQGTCFTSREA